MLNRKMKAEFLGGGLEIALYFRENYKRYYETVNIFNKQGAK